MPSNVTKTSPSWHSLRHEEVMEELNTSLSGLSEEEAILRLKQFGPNEIKDAKDNRWVFIEIFIRQFKNSLIYLLLGSCLISFLLNKPNDALAIFLVVILNILIGFFQEYKSNIAIDALFKLIPQTALVIREGKRITIKSKDLVRGDIVLLNAGDKIAADVRLIESKNFQCEEASLTGESEPVSKNIDTVDASTTIAEQKCMAFSGTLVSTGFALACVVETGFSTEFGKISKLLREVKPQDTPLNLSLKNISKWITISVIFISLIQILVAYFRGYTFVDSVLASIALAVATIPEGLPATITIAAAIGVERMAKKNAIIKHLLTVETLGSTSVICTDKTGTLTQNEMTVQAISTKNQDYFITGVGYSKEGDIVNEQNNNSNEDIKSNLNDLKLCMTLCNDSSLEFEFSKPIISGDPTEIALLVLAEKLNLPQKEANLKFKRLDTIPFESEKRMMATLNKKDNHSNVIYVKGAPECLIYCLKEDLKEFIENQVIKYAKQGMRVLMMIQKIVPSSMETLNEKDIKSGFDFLGLAAIIDPPRKEVFDAISSCKEAGIDVKMITGDHPITALKIAKELNLTSNDEVLLGSSIEALSKEDLKKQIVKHEVIARALPEHKLKIVEALQSLGKITAMTGDGVNDAPALKLADIGISMNLTGSEVAKEASDMILTDDNFQSIKAAVEEGRRVYDNLVKSITFMFPTNMALALIIMIAIFFFPIKSEMMLLPILPAQILWINLIVAVALSLPLCFEAMEPDVMKRKPRKSQEKLLNKTLVFKTIFISSVMTTGTIYLFLDQYFSDIQANIAPSISLSEAQTMSATTIVFFQLFYLFNCRSLKHSFLKIGFFKNKFILVGSAFVILSHLCFVYLPIMNQLFGSHPLTIKSLLLSIAVGALILPIAGLQKFIFNKIEKQNLTKK